MMVTVAASVVAVVTVVVVVVAAVSWDVWRAGKRTLATEVVTVAAGLSLKE